MWNKILYHANCHDGLTAAFLAAAKFPGATLIPVDYKDPQPPPFAPTDQVLIVDFSYKRPVMEAIRKDVAALLVLDHHKTAEAELKGLDCCVFDMNECGASLVWRSFYTRPMPHGLAMIRDRDLWLGEHPDTPAFTMGLGLIDKEPDPWLHAVLHNWQAVINNGNTLLSYQRRQIQQWVQQPDMVVWPGFEHRVPVVNTNLWMSDVGNELLTIHPTAPFSVTWYEQRGLRHFSLRSENSRADVSEIAKGFGGGGHRNASGFNLPVHQPYPWNI